MLVCFMQCVVCSCVVVVVWGDTCDICVDMFVIGGVNVMCG